MPTIATGLKISVANTPQAKDDVYGSLEDFSALLDVLCNDLGGAAKTLYSLSRERTFEDGGDVTAASMISGIPVQSVTTYGGATATIVDGMIAYATNGSFDHLGEGEQGSDTFSYIIRLSSGAFSIATVTVNLVGSNDAPVISIVGADSASAAINETNAGLTANGSLTVTDIDTSDTVDVSVSSVATGGTGGTGGLSNADLKAMLSLVGHVDNAADGTAGSLDWTFDSGSRAFDYLAAGETLILTYTLTATDSAPLTPLSDTQTVTITITGTNDAPVLTVAATGSLAEDGTDPVLSTSGSLGIADADTTDTHVITTGVTSVVWSGGSLTPAEQAALAAGFSADADSWDYSVANSAVQFLDTGETLVLTFTVTATDDSGAPNNSDSRTVTVTITGTNDAPVLTGTAASLANGLEDNSYTVTQAQLLAGWTDVDGETLVATGLTATNGTVVANADGSYTITPSANYNGPVTLNYSVGDGTATVAASLSYTLLPVNDAPAGTNGTVALLEDGSHGFTAADFGFSDAVEGDALAAVIITTLPGAGSLTLNGIAVNAGDTIAAADIGGLRFTPAANANGAGYASFTFQVRDNGGTADGGVDTDPTPNTITITVTPVNDAPLNVVPASQSVDEDTLLAISGVSVGDIDSLPLTATLSVNHGTLDVANIVGLGIVGDGTGTVVLTGSAAQINLALAGLNYTGNPDYFGSDTLTVETDDGALTDTDTVAITVNPVADLPVETRVNNAADDRNFDNPSLIAAFGGATVHAGDFNGGGGNDTILGSAAGQELNGQGGGDTIHGAGGDDDITGGGGDDTLYGGFGNDEISGDGGTDIIYGGSDNDIITGVGGNETIYGGSGNDDISGGAGADQLWGGTGQDDFIFGLTDSTAASRDQINDFSHAEDDNINLTAFTNFSAADWIGVIASPAALTSGGLGYVINLDGSLTLYGDHDGNGVADFAVDIMGVGSLQTSDFLFGGP